MRKPVKIHYIGPVKEPKMSKRKERIAAKDQRDFKKFTTTLLVITLILVVLVYIFFVRQL